MRLLAIVAVVVLALALTDARTARRTQRGGQAGPMARRMMRNRGMGGNKPMSMRRSPYGPVGRRDNGPSMEMNSGRRATIGGDKLDKSLEKISGPMYELYASLEAMGTLKAMCTENWAAKRDVNEDYIEGAADFIDKSTLSKDASDITAEVDTIADVYFWLKCDHELFCDNLEIAQDYYSYYYDTVEDEDFQYALEFCGLD